MDQVSLEKLELDSVLDRLEGWCGSAGGRALVNEIHVHMSERSVQEQLDRTSEARRLLDTDPPDWDFGAMPDLAPVLDRLDTQSALEPADLHALRMGLEFAERVYKSTPPEDEYPTVADLAGTLFTEPDLVRRIARAIDEEGHVLDTASPALAKARRRVRSLEQDIPKLLNSFVNDPGNQDLVQERIVTMRNGRFVVPVVAGRSGGGRFVLQDRSASGASAFVEPLDVVDKNNNLIQERLNERNEVLAVLRDLTARALEHEQELRAMLRTLSELDLLLARGKLSADMQAVAPSLTADDSVIILSGRHPLLREDVVPVDISLGGDVRALILTGPNAGGKTVALKMIGLFQLMAQAGLHVPAEAGTSLPVFNDVFAVIGDEQSIEHSLSTFTSHLYDIGRILRRAERGALVLVDEICSGTDPAEGTALACSVIKQLMDLGAVCMATSHHGGLKTFASVTPGARNARVLFDEDEAEPRYVVEIGAAGKSHALDIAARAGIPQHIIHGARDYLDAQTRMAEEMIAELEHLKGALAVERSDLKRREEEIKQEREKAKQELSAAEKERRETLRRAVAEADQLVEQTRDKCRNILDSARGAATLPDRAEVKGEIKKVSHKVQKAAKKTAPRRGRKLTLKDLVPDAPLLLRDTGDAVTFVSGPDRRGAVKVLLGGLTMTTHVRNLAVPDKPPPPKPAPRPSRDHEKLIAEARERTTDRIDIHGLRVAEAVELLEREIEDMHLAGRETCHVVHGIGTGALRDAVQEYLGGHPLVRRLEPAPLNQGGIGVTIAVLKD